MPSRTVPSVFAARRAAGPIHRTEKGAVLPTHSRRKPPTHRRIVPTSGSQRAHRGGRRRARRSVALVVLLVLVALAAVELSSTGSGHRTAAGGSSGASARSNGVVGPALDPSLFSEGSCMSFPPTVGDRHETVFLDAGHGGIDPGAIGTTEAGRTIYEADETLPVELDAMKLLRAKGFQVVVSRTRASSVIRLLPSDVANGVLTLKGAHDDVAVRDICANLAKAVALVGIYFDAGATAANAGSVAAYDAARPFWRSSLALATVVERDVIDAMNAHGWAIPNEGVLPDGGLGSSVPTAPGTGGSLAADAASYDHLLLLGPAMTGYFTTPSAMPGTVVEPLFITDPFEGSIAASTEGQQVMAGGIAAAVEQYLRTRSAT